MATDDDLTTLASESVLYLTRTLKTMEGNLQNQGLPETFRGRLHQALSGNWVFNTSVAQNGVLGFAFSSGSLIGWGFTRSPSAGMQATFFVPVGTIQESYTIATLVPADFQD